jgi:hypothetical protein
MEITLEKIELVKDRTGCTYAEAKAALEAAEGSVVDAIIAMEEKSNADHDRIDGGSLKDSPIFAKMKEIVDKGNVSKIIISKNGKKVVSFPVTVGVVGTVLVPWGAVLGMVAAMGTQCSIDFMDDKGRIIDIDGKVTSVLEKAVDAGNTVKDIIKDTTDSYKSKGLQEEEKKETERGLKDEDQ